MVTKHTVMLNIQSYKYCPHVISVYVMILTIQSDQFATQH